MTQKELVKIAETKMVEIFGKEFIIKENGTFSLVKGECMDNVFVYFAGFSDPSDTSILKPNRKGWYVYYELYLAEDTGEILSLEYQTVDGRIGKPNWDAIKNGKR